MTSKKKLAISISALCVIVVAAVVSVVAVFAARNASFSGNFNGGYTAYHVDATITGAYKVGGSITDDTGWQTLTTSAEDNSITFTADMATGSATATFDSVNDIVLKSTDNVIFKYSITNDSANTSFTITGSQTGTFENLNVAYYYQTTTADAQELNITSGLTLNANEVVTIFVVITIDNIDINATLDGSVNWTLTAVE